MDKKRRLEEMRSLLEKTTFTPADRIITAYLEEIGSAMLRDRVSLWELLRRPEVTIDDLLTRSLVPEMKKEISEQLEIQSKYEGYIQKQQEQVKRFEKLESKAIPADMEYQNIKTLSSEAMQKLEQFKPETIGRPHAFQALLRRM
jgi:tRNA uridine 5-carboxymethylaminomethyl modification enzyme